MSNEFYWIAHHHFDYLMEVDASLTIIADYVLSSIITFKTNWPDCSHLSCPYILCSHWLLVFDLAKIACIHVQPRQITVIYFLSILVVLWIDSNHSSRPSFMYWHFQKFDCCYFEHDRLIGFAVDSAAAWRICPTCAIRFDDLILWKCTVCYRKSILRCKSYIFHCLWVCHAFTIHNWQIRSFELWACITVYYLF